jgi:uncharacterized protein (TIGR02588 family)
MTDGEREGRSGSRDERADDGGGGHNAPQATSPWEWLVGLAGAVLVAATVAFMGYQAATDEDTPPDIVIQVDSVSRLSGGYVVEFRAKNVGGTTAAQVQVQGELRGAAGVVETSGVSIDYVPSSSERRAGLLFRQDPRRHRLEVRATGYDLP